MSLQSINANQRDQSQPKLPYPNNALRCDLIRVREAWRKSRRRHDRFSIYKYLTAVFDLVAVWQTENRAVDRAKRALWMKRREHGDNIEPFAAVIRCTSPRNKVDAKARSKWARALIFAANINRLPSRYSILFAGTVELIYVLQSSVVSAEPKPQLGRTEY